MTRFLLASFSVALILAPVALAAEADAVGRWDLTINPPKGTPAWIAIEKKDGAYTGRFQPPAGAMVDAKDVKVDGRKVTFEAGGLWEGELHGDRLSGTVTRNGNKQQFLGRRFVAPVDPNGAWQLKLDSGETPILTLLQSGEMISGYMSAGAGAGARVLARLEGNTLKFSGAFPEAKDRPLGGQVRATAVIRGDKIEGELEGGNGKHKFSGERRREWGETVQLFNGKDLDGWKPLGDPDRSHWKVVDGIMVNAAKGANLVSDKKFENFKIHVEFRVPEGGNSGVYLRGRYEIQVADSFGKEPSGGSCGAIYSRIVPSVNASKKPGEWQTFDATLIGNYLTVVHNGQTIVDNQEVEGITGGAIDSEEHAPGPIYLQGDHTAVEYRKIEVTPAKPTLKPLVRVRAEPATKPQ